MEDEIGLRVADPEGYYGTIRYVGEVTGTKGIWYGVDWDDETRGKHDGSHDENKYFWTHFKTSGSFVRKNKLNFGITFMEGVHKKYVEEDDALVVKEQVDQVKKSINAPFVEMVGFDKVHKQQTCFEKLIEVSLRDMVISNAGPSHNEIEQSIPNIEELDLSKNLFSSWFSIAEITSQLKYLNFLSVSNNRLPIPNEEDIMSAVLPHGKIHTLIMVNMGYTWKDILKLVANFPITCLKIPENKITTLENQPGMFTCLEELDLQYNNIVDWHEINSLGHLPNLKSLNVGSTNLKNIILNKDGELFPVLESLFISNNKLDSWDHISQLHYLKRLTMLRCTKNPILSNQNQSSWIGKLVARIGTLKILNGSVVDRHLRSGSEYDYLKEYANVYYGKNKEDFFESNPRYEILVQKHGPPFKEDLKAKQTVIELTFILENENKKLKKKIPLTVSISKLINLVQRSFHNSCTPQLYYMSDKNLDQKIELNNDELQNIDYYNLQNGDTIYVSFLDD